jgi:hypothetical protein
VLKFLLLPEQSLEELCNLGKMEKALKVNVKAMVHQIELMHQLKQQRRKERAC